MGVMTLSDFQNDLKDASGRANIDVGRLNRAINNAMFEFAYAFEFPELQKNGLIDTVQGQNAYDLPTDFRALGEAGVRIDAPEDRFGGILEPETRTNFLRNFRYPSSATQGVVGYYHMYGRQLWMRPTPDGVASTIGFDYWAKVPKLTNPTDVTVFMDDWDEVLYRGALYRIHMAYGEHDRMINIFNLYIGLIRSRVMEQDLQEFPEGGISYIQNQFDNLRR